MIPNHDGVGCVRGESPKQPDEQPVDVDLSDKGLEELAYRQAWRSPGVRVSWLKHVRDAAQREARREMRERAAQEADDFGDGLGRVIARDIRALPDDPPKDGA